MLNHDGSHSPHASTSPEHKNPSFHAARLDTDSLRQALTFLKHGEGAEPLRTDIALLSELGLAKVIDRVEWQRSHERVQTIPRIRELVASTSEQLEQLRDGHRKLETLRNRHRTHHQKQLEEYNTLLRARQTAADRSRNPLWQAMFFVGRLLRKTETLPNQKQTLSKALDETRLALARTVHDLERTETEIATSEASRHGCEAQLTSITGQLQTLLKEEQNLAFFRGTTGGACLLTRLGAELLSRLSSPAVTTSGHWTDCLAQINREARAFEKFEERLQRTKEKISDVSYFARLALAPIVAASKEDVEKICERIKGVPPTWEEFERLAVSIVEGSALRSDSSPGTSSHAATSYVLSEALGISERHYRALHNQAVHIISTISNCRDFTKESADLVATLIWGETSPECCPKDYAGIVQSLAKTLIRSADLSEEDEKARVARAERDRVRWLEEGARMNLFPPAGYRLG